MAVDREYRIRITTVAEPAGAQEAAKAIEEVAEATKRENQQTEESAKKTSFLNLKKTELKKLVRELAHEFPIAGMAAKAMLNPIMFTLTTAVGLFAAAKSKLDDWNKSMDEAAEEAAKSFGDIRAAQWAAINDIDASKVAYEEWAKSLSSHNGEITQTLDDQNKKLHAQADAVKAIAQAELAKAKAQIEANPNMSPEEKQIRMTKLDAESRKLESQVDASVAQKELAATTEALLRTSMRQAMAKLQADEAHGQAEDFGRKSRLGALPGEIQTAEEKLAKAQAKAAEEGKKAQETSGKWNVWLQNLFPKGSQAEMNAQAQIKAAQDKEARATAERDALQVYADKLKKEQHDLQRQQERAEAAAEAAKKKTEEYKGESETLSRRREQLRTAIQVSQETQPTLDKFKSQEAAAKLFGNIVNTPLGQLINAAGIVDKGEDARRKRLMGGTLTQAEKDAMALEDRVDPQMKQLIMKVGNWSNQHTTTLHDTAEAIQLMNGNTEQLLQLVRLVIAHQTTLRNDVQNSLSRQLGNQVRGMMNP